VAWDASFMYAFLQGVGDKYLSRWFEQYEDIISSSADDTKFTLLQTQAPAKAQACIMYYEKYFVLRMYVSQFLTWEISWLTPSLNCP
jgi:hypothetical protein